MNSNRFIPFDKQKKEAQVQTFDNDLLNLAIAISLESSKLLECVSNKDSANSINFATQLKQKLEQIISKMPAQKIMSASFINDTIKEELDRVLNNGGLAPPKEWKSITEISLKNSEKNNLVEEMRKLKEQGKTINKSTYHHKNPINIEEFTEPFKYMENMHDYNGSFLITLLKSDMEISNQANTLQIDLSLEKDACANGDRIILSVYDITGSASIGEEKKFLIVLLFDKLLGTLRYGYPIFMNEKKHSLSTRQTVEIEKFCKAKKINLY